MVSSRAPSCLVPYVEENHVCFVDSYVVIAAECGLDLGRPVLEAPRTESTDRGGSIFGLCTRGGIHNDLSCLVVPSLRDFASPPPYSISSSCCPLSCLSVWQQKQKESSDDDDDTTSFNNKSFHGALVCTRPISFIRVSKSAGEGAADEADDGWDVQIMAMRSRSYYSNSALQDLLP
jgi:hypothetical protein